MELTEFVLFEELSSALIYASTINFKKATWQRLEKPKKVYVYLDKSTQSLLIKKCPVGDEKGINIHLLKTNIRIVSKELTDQLREIMNCNENNITIKGKWDEELKGVLFKLKPISKTQTTSF